MRICSSLFWLLLLELDVSSLFSDHFNTYKQVEERMCNPMKTV